MKWFDLPLTPMKIGTVPHLVLVHGADQAKLKPGSWVRIKESEGDKWHPVLVEHVNDHGDIFSAR